MKLINYVDQLVGRIDILNNAVSTIATKLLPHDEAKACTGTDWPCGSCVDYISWYCNTPAYNGFNCYADIKRKFRPYGAAPCYDWCTDWDVHQFHHTGSGGCSGTNQQIVDWCKSHYSEPWCS